MKCPKHGIRFRSGCPSCELDAFRALARPESLPSASRFTARARTLRDGRVWWQVLEAGMPFPVKEGTEPNHEMAAAEAELWIETRTASDPVTEWTPLA